MNSSNYDYLCTILVLGGSSSGRSSLLHRFIDDVYQTQAELDSIPAENPSYKTKTVSIGKTIVKLKLWDLNPQLSKFITRSYSRGAQGLVLVYNFYEQTLDDVRTWAREIESDVNTSGLKRVLIGHHYQPHPDDNKPKTSSTQDILQLAENLGYMYSEANSKTGENVEEAFTLLVDQIVKAKLSSKLEDDIIEDETHQSCIARCVIA